MVPNPSFEYYLSCDSLEAALLLGNFPPWDSPSQGSVDGFNPCDTVHGYGAPFNGLGWQNAHSGIGYAGGGFYCSNINGFEYLQVKLDTPLVDQQEYCVSFYVAKSNRTPVASNNIGMYISDVHVYVPSLHYLNFTPQINDTSIISDTVNWTLIYGTYTSHGGERYIVIGNFFAPTLSDTLHSGGSGATAYGYYYIDDVNVHCCSCDSTTSLHAGVAEITKPPNFFNLFPNPNDGKMTMEYEMEGTYLAILSIYSIDGRLVKLLTLNTNEKSITIDASELKEGVYYYTVKEDGKIVKTEKLVIVR